MRRVKLGRFATLEFESAPNQWTEIEAVKDVTLSVDAAEVDITTRASGGWKEYVAGLRDVTLEFEMVIAGNTVKEHYPA